MSSPINLITRVIEPVYHSNTRTRFKLNCMNNGLLPNLRLVDLKLSGIVYPAGTAPAYPYYKTSSGVLALIKRVTLTEKGNPIEDLSQLASNWMTFQNLIDDQSNAESVKQYTVKSRMATNAAVDVGNIASRLDNSVLGDGTAPIVNANSGCRLDLQRYLNFLKSEDLLVGFKDMELVFEWETEANKIFDRSQNAGGDSDYPTDFVVDEPKLVFEEILNKDFVQQQAMAKRGTQTSFLTPEVEYLSVAANAVLNSEVKTKLRLNGFRNKVMHKLMVSTYDPTIGVDRQNGANISMTQGLEKWQVYVNNAQLFQEEVSTASRKLATLSDSFGRLVVPFWMNKRAYSNNIILGAIRPIVDNDNQADPDELGYIFNTMSYFGCDIKDQISDLRLEFTRTTDAGGANALTLNCFGLVEKSVVYGKDGEVSVSY